ncbi:MAG: DNA polymerase IV [Halanaerobiaceae bacterium]
MPLNIVHVDMDAFFASVEQLDNPELQGKPVIVGGSGNGDSRGVVSAASYEARKYGVHSAMPLVEARRLCPEGHFVPVRGDRYSEVSRQVFDIFYEYTPRLEKISIDEAFLDLQGCHQLFGSSREIGKKIRNEIKERIGITASVGIAPNKFLAKLASDMDKPDGFVVIEEEKIKDVLAPLPVDDIWGVGEKTFSRFQELGIKTIEDLWQLSEEELVSLFGKKGKKLFYLSRGIDDRRVEVEEDTVSISHERTFASSLTDDDEISAALMEMSERVVRRMRKKGLRGRTVFIKIRYDDFETLTRSLTQDRLISRADILYETGKTLLKKYSLLKRPVRLLGIGLSNLSGDKNVQLSLFEDKEKDERLTGAIDVIKDKFGENSIFRARKLLDTELQNGNISGDKKNEDR